MLFGNLFSFRGAAAQDEAAQAPDVAERELSADEPVPALGAVTGCDLSDIGCLTQPMRRDPFGRLRPAFSPQAARLSLELANMSYTLDIDPWVRAGWYDLSIQIDNALQSGLTVGEAATGERMRAAISAMRVRRARAALDSRNPITQIMGALRQRESSDTIKAVVMMHRRPEGGYLLAIGFMGTGKRIYDWISNFRFTTEEGFHKGFWQLCAYFEKSESQIIFPETAQELGLERLTLGDVLSEMRNGSSRFRLWMAGHSQGGAVMQLFAHRLMLDGGVQPGNMVGYGFASPTVVTPAAAVEPAAYPLYHILNSDDMVPRAGAAMHLGLCLQYQADDALRKATYGWSDLPGQRAAREALFPYALQMVDTPSILLYSTAFVQCMVEERGEEGLNTLMNKWWSLKPIDHLFAYAGDRALSWTERMVNHAKAGYLAVTGREMDETELALIRDNMRPMVREQPVRRLLAALCDYCVSPHHIALDDGGDGAYSYIARYGMDALRPFIWSVEGGNVPSKRFAAYRTSAERITAEQAARKRRAAPKRAPAAGKRAVGLSAQRAKKG